MFKTIKQHIQTVIAATLVGTMALAGAIDVQASPLSAAGWVYDGSQTSAFGSGTGGVNIQPGTSSVIRGPGGYIQMNNGGAGIEIFATDILNLSASTAVRLATSVQTSNGRLIDSATAPTISSGFGTTPTISASNGTGSFKINVGTGGVATTGVIGLPVSTTGWNCDCEDITTHSTTVFRCRQTGAGTTTTVPIGNFTSAAAAGAWVASDILAVKCRAN